MIVGRTMWTQSTSVTDRQTDGRTDRQTDRITITDTVQRIASHGKNRYPCPRGRDSTVRLHFSAVACWGWWAQNNKKSHLSSGNRAKPCKFRYEKQVGISYSDQNRKVAFSTTALSIDTASPANPDKYRHKPYIARNYRPWATSVSLTVYAHLYLFENNHALKPKHPR